MMILQIGKLNNKGVTLIELCLVGVILSIIFAISWPIINHTIKNTQLQVTCNEISYLFKYARDSALNESKYYCVQFNVPDRQYWLSTKKDSTSDSITFVKVEGSLYNKRAWPDGIQVYSISDQQVIFYPDGTSQDFEISFKNNTGNNITLKLQGNTGRTIIK